MYKDERGVWERDKSSKLGNLMRLSVSVRPILKDYLLVCEN